MGLMQIELNEEKEDEASPIRKEKGKLDQSTWDVFDIEAVLQELSESENEQEEETKYENEEVEEKVDRREIMRRLQNSKHMHQSHSTSSLRSIGTHKLPTFKRSAVSNVF